MVDLIIGGNTNKEPQILFMTKLILTQYWTSEQ